MAMGLDLTLPLLLFSLSSSLFLVEAAQNRPNLSREARDLSFDGSLKPEFRVILRGNDTITSVNRTFRLGFFSPNDESNWYLGIWYVSIPIRTYVWVANREKPVSNLLSAAAVITTDGRLAVVDYYSSAVAWATSNSENASGLVLLEQGNLVLLNGDGGIVWQSFDFPANTWLPGMNLTAGRRLTSWKSSIDPSPGRYSLKLNPAGYGEIALYFSNGNSIVVDDDDDERNLHLYWSTGNWNGDAFDGVPEMTIPYIYRFEFIDPFTPMASFGYSEVPLERGVKPPLTRFMLDHTGQLKQFTWSQQSEIWNMFWSQPENLCHVFSLCGNWGICSGEPLSPCRCLNGFRPVNGALWDKEDFGDGCWRDDGAICGVRDEFEEVGVVSLSHEKMDVVSFTASRSDCERACLQNCSCVGLYHNAGNNGCKNLYGLVLNLENVSTSSEDKLFVRLQAATKRRSKKMGVLIGVICGVVVMLSIGMMNLLYLMKQKVRRRKGEEGVIQVMNLRVFSYKELHAASKGFSEKLGHGGFGAVFRGVLSDSSDIAVKRLERPGGGEKEFRAEVCTIGNIQHVNLVRLRGFCCESAHRLLVYDFMPNGPLSTYLRHGGTAGKCLSWDVRFRVAVGTARGIAYLHEECRNCIIHCDIKPENILLDQNFSAKVSDFGLAKLIGRDLSRVVATMRGTWGYVAPEWISGVAITTKADVYSYGMTLLELIGGRRNVEGPPIPSGGSGSGTGTDKWFFPPWAARQIIEGNVAGIVDERLGEAYDKAEAERVALVAVWCIQDEESARPAMGMVVKMLEGVVEVGVPPPPKLLQALVSGESFQGIGIGIGKKGPKEEDNSSSSMDNTIFVGSE